MRAVAAADVEEGVRGADPGKLEELSDDLLRTPGRERALQLSSGRARICRDEAEEGSRRSGRAWGVAETGPRY